MSKAPKTPASKEKVSVVKRGQDKKPWIVITHNKKKKWAKTEKHYSVTVQINYEDRDDIIEFLAKDRDFKSTFDGTGMDLKREIYEVFYYPKNGKQMAKMQNKLVSLEKSMPIRSYKCRFFYVPVEQSKSKSLPRKKFLNLF